MRGAGWSILVILLLAAACTPAVAPSPTPTPIPTPSPQPAPTPVALTDDDCPIPADIDGGEFRRASCPTIIGLANALRVGDVDGIVALAAVEEADCAPLLEEEPELDQEFPQCGAVPPPRLSGQVWCPDPVHPTCEIQGADAYREALAELLAAVDAGAQDEHGTGDLSILGFDPCGPTVVMRTTMIVGQANAAGLAAGRWIADFFMRRRPLLADEPVSDQFMIRRVDAATLETFLATSADPLSEGRCDPIIEWQPW